MIRISYSLRRDSPLYPGTPPLLITSDKSLDRGDSSNSSVFALSSHSTTHLDMPLHFCPSGHSVSDLPGDELVFFPTYCLDVPKKDDECIADYDIPSSLAIHSDAEALLIKTGYSHFRLCGNDKYTHHHPWVHPDLPEYLRNVFPHLKLVCFDILSVSVPGHRHEGQKTHKSFLCGSPPILILEDANLSDRIAVNKKYFLRIYPWIFEDTDGVPVLAFLSEK